MLVIFRLIYLILGGISFIILMVHKHHIFGFRVTNKVLSIIIGSTFLVCFSMFLIDYFFDFFIDFFI